MITIGHWSLWLLCPKNKFRKTSYETKIHFRFFLSHKNPQSNCILKKKLRTGFTRHNVTDKEAQNKCYVTCLIRKSIQWLYVTTPKWFHFEECMCRLQNIAECDYHEKRDFQKSGTTGETDDRQIYLYMLL